jgi:putative salt-induced outer membrane protein
VAYANPFYAPPPPQEDAPVFSGDAELGFTRLSGNTDSQTLIGKTLLTWLTGNFTYSLRGEVRNVTKDDETSAEQYLVAGRERYELDGPHYLFGFARWEKDRFAGYDQQLSAIGGYGRQILESNTHLLSLEAGPGYRHDRLREHGDYRLAVAYTALDYHWFFSDYADIQQEMSFEYTDQNTTSRSLTALTARLNSKLSLRLSHEIKHNSQPPDDTSERTDNTTSASLLYRW